MDADALIDMFARAAMSMRADLGELQRENERLRARITELESAAGAPADLAP